MHHHLLAGSAFLTIAATALAQGSPWVHPDGTTHWYEVVVESGGISWNAANYAANAAGGYLATITSSQENDFVFSLIDTDFPWEIDDAHVMGPWIGGVQPTGSFEPAGGWQWARNEPFAYSNWSASEPDDGGGADCMHYGDGQARVPTWSDAPATTLLRGYVIERSGATAPLTAGLQRREPASFDGYSLLAPLFSTDTFLLDPCGRQVHGWSSTYRPGMSAYLLDNGDLLRTAFVNSSVFRNGGSGGRLERYDWGGSLQWSFDWSTATQCQHHDVQQLPNGNVLFISWELKTTQEALAAGRDPALLLNPRLLPDAIYEVQPGAGNGGQIVWEWHAWDHLVQDFDPQQANYGVVAQHPELIDVNFPPLGSTMAAGIDDWMHSNAVSYNAALDQVILSVRHFNEFWIIDHSTTTAEAASHQGGRSGHGGDLLYRWGNPASYRAGTANDRQLFNQHDADWVPPGLPGAGNILVFDNGVERPAGAWSSVVEVAPPTPDANGNYARPAAAFGPSQPAWTWQAADPTTFFSMFIGGAQRLPNGNTLVCSGWQANAFEVTPQGDVVWSYITPVNGTTPAMQGDVLSQNQMFRMLRYPAGYSGFSGRTLTPGEPIEQQAPVLLANGSPIPAWVRVGSSIDLTVNSPADAGLPYVVLTSMTAGVVPVDYRFLRLGYDWLLYASLVGGTPFQGYAGVLDAQGRAGATLVIPPLPALAGIVLHSTFAVVDAAAPSGLGTFGNGLVVRIDP